MPFRLRVLPLAIIAATGLLGLKLGNLWLAADVPFFAAARAQGESEKAAKPAHAMAPLPDSPPHAAAGRAGVPPVKAQAMAPPMAEPEGERQAIDPLSMSPAEVELLQKLAERRANLDKRAAEQSQREVLLEAAEKRIDEKIAKLEALKKEIAGLADKQNAEDDARLKSLVKIYETMKPHDAARIFEQLDMPVLLGVVERMKERNAAPILAALDPAKAKAVTLALAERRDRLAKAETMAPSKPAAKP
jgi:flagellar motility protein MotE (MotC chaperone)